jgi:adenosylcobinamide hydrolase
MIAAEESGELMNGWNARPETRTHMSGGQRWPLLLWQLPEPMVAITSAPLGGGVGLRAWVINAQVEKEYSRVDVNDYLREIAVSAGASGTGVGMLTAARVDDRTAGSESGIRSFASVGVTTPAWASAEDDDAYPATVGTVNVVAFLPVRLSDAALVNAVMTVTEAKTQALFEAKVPGTGTASDAVCILCLAGGEKETFCGPRSRWGARLARAVHEAVTKGIRRGAR